MFKAEITEEYTEIKGTCSEKLAGLACYIEALRENGIEDILIRKAVEIGFEDKKNERKEEVITKEIKLDDISNELKEFLKKLIN